MKCAILPVIYCLLAAATGNAQRFPFYNIGIENGLIQSQVISLTQDDAGHLWIATLGGLSRYDGHSFTNFTTRDGLPSNNINEIAAAPGGRLYIATQRGLCLYDGHIFFTLRLPAKGGYHSPVARVITSASGTFTCISGSQLIAGNGNQFQILEKPHTADNPSGITEDISGSLFVACARAPVIRMRGNRILDSIYVTGTSSTPQPFVFGFSRDRYQRIWALTDKGAYRITEGKGPADTNLILLKGQPVLSMVQHEDGAYWLSTTAGGVWTIRREGAMQFTKKNGLSDNTITSLLRDAEGNIWLGSDGQGLYRFSGAPFDVLDESAGLPSAQIMGIATDSSGDVFLGTYDAGLCVFRNGTITSLALPGQKKPAVTGLVLLPDGLWIGTRNAGIFRYSAGRFTQFNVENRNLPSGLVSCLRKASGNRLYAGFINGAAVLNHGVFTKLPAVPGAVQDFAEFSPDSVLVGTTSGNYLVTAGRTIPFITGAAPDSALTSCFALQGSRLWIGTTDNGVICYDMATKACRVFNSSNGFRSDFVYNLLIDKNGALWAGTGYGIHRIVATATGFTVSHFGREQGVAGMESNHNAAALSADGSLWFGTTGGALHYQEKPFVHPRPVSIVLQSVRLYGEPITDSSYFSGVTPMYGVPIGLRLPWKQNNLSFTFHAISLTGAERALYRYRIAGVDASWSEWTPVATVTYSSLPPGRHGLVVQCSTGDKARQELHYSFEIITPFHQTGLFRVSMVGALILLGVGLQYSANRRKAKRLKLIEALRREEQSIVRQRTAEDFHDEVGNRLTRINVLANVLKARLPKGSTEAERLVEQIKENAGQLYSGTRDILWSLSPANDTLYEIIHRIRDFGRDLFGDTEVAFVFEGSDESWKNIRLPMDASRNLIMIFKEAMNNALKYSGADVITLKATKTDARFELSLQDNGIGFDTEQVRKGNGLNNMSIRAKRINGAIHIQSQPAGGHTVIRLSFKIPSMKG